MISAEKRLPGRGRGEARPDAGLTLVEVVLAVTILGTTLVALLTAASRCLAVMKMAKNYQTAQWTMGMGELDYPLIVSNEVEELNVEPETYPNGFTFSREVEEEDPDDEDGLHVLRTRVSWAQRGKQAYEESVRYVFVPPEDEE